MIFYKKKVNSLVGLVGERRSSMLEVPGSNLTRSNVTFVENVIQNLAKLNPRNSRIMDSPLEEKQNTK